MSDAVAILATMSGGADVGAVPLQILTPTSTLCAGTNGAIYQVALQEGASEGDLVIVCNTMVGNTAPTPVEPDGEIESTWVRQTTTGQGNQTSIISCRALVAGDISAGEVEAQSSHLNTELAVIVVQGSSAVPGSIPSSGVSEGSPILTTSITIPNLSGAGRPEWKALLIIATDYGGLTFPETDDEDEGWELIHSFGGSLAANEMRWHIYEKPCAPGTDSGSTVISFTGNQAAVWAEVFALESAA